MLPKLKLSAFLLKRLEGVKQQCSGCLFGCFYDGGTLLVMGFNVESTIGHLNYEQIQHKFPAELDLCGLVKFGDCTEEEANATEIFKDVDITDNPLLLHLPELGSLVDLRASVFMHGKLQQLPYEVMSAEQLYSDFCFTRLRCGLDLYTEQKPQAVRHAMHALRKLVSGGSLVFHVEPTNIYVTNVCAHDNNSGNDAHRIGNESHIGDVVRSIIDAVQNIEEDKENERTSGRKARAKAGGGDSGLSRLYGAVGCDFDVLDIQVLRCKTRDHVTVESTSDIAVNANSVLTSVGMCVQRHNEMLVHVPLEVEALAVLCKRTKVVRLYDVLIESICRSLRLFEQSLVDRLEESEVQPAQLLVPRSYHFFPQEFGHFLTCSYLDGVSDDESSMQEKRKRLHRHFGLSVMRPYFRRANACHFRADLNAQAEDTPLLNPHVGLRPSGVSDGQQHLVQGNYFYYHYLQQQQQDKGWGCAYRSLQTLCSWFQLQGYTERAVPSHRDIQQYLVRIGDKQSSFLGSTQWIGSTEVSMCLQGFLNVDSMIKHVTSGAELAYLATDLAIHFQTQGTPIMIGGGVLAHTIIGVDFCAQSGAVKFLILDPHYTGADDLQTVQAKGWCGWKGVDFWDKKSYYNLCMPQRPIMF